MKYRYRKTLQQHVKIVSEHTEYLVKQLQFQIKDAARLFKKYNFKKGDPYSQDIILRYKRMKEIKAELECVKEYVILQWPHLKELFEQLDKVEINEDTLKPIEAKWEKVSTPGQSIPVQ